MFKLALMVIVLYTLKRTKAGFIKYIFQLKIVEQLYSSEYNIDMNSIYEMNLCSKPFDSIVNHGKTIEMRLDYEKRKAIKIGDIIRFTKNSTKEQIDCLVTNIYRYKTFDEMYKHHDKIALGYKEDEPANPEDMLEYYTQENIEKYMCEKEKMRLFFLNFFVIFC